MTRPYRGESEAEFSGNCRPTTRGQKLTMTGTIRRTKTRSGLR